MSDKINLLLKDKSTLIWPIAAISVSILMIAFIIVPQVINFSKTKGDIDQIHDQVSVLNKKAADLAAVDTTKAQDNLKIALAALPNERDIPALLGQTQTLLSQSGMLLKGMDFSNAGNVPLNGAQSFNIHITADGSEQALKSFINNLSSSPILIKLSGVDVAGQRDGSFEATLVLTSYYQAPPTTLGSLERPVDVLTSQDLALLSKISDQLRAVPVISSTEAEGPRGKPNPFQ